MPEYVYVTRSIDRHGKYLSHNFEIFKTIEGANAYAARVCEGVSLDKGKVIVEVKEIWT